MKVFLVLLSVLWIEGSFAVETRRFVSTTERILSNGYPVEEHRVRTSDNYILTVFRIPYSNNLNNENATKPVVFIMHGLLSSSDGWILNGPENSLAFLLSDAGYDVWLGNARGNVYSKKHLIIPTILPKFWDFSWHEIAVNDIPAMINYILKNTGDTSLHYVGHSQGTTAYFILMSTLAQYNDKIKSTHLLAPVAFMEHMESPIVAALAPLLENPSALSALIGPSEFMPSNDLLHLLAPALCRERAMDQAICNSIFFLIGGWDSSHFNYTALEYALETHPAGSSAKQLIHYIQLRKSAKFRQYDHGLAHNLIKYLRPTPPDYELQQIQQDKPIYLYYSDNDYFAHIKDVDRLIEELGNNVEPCRIKYEDFNHVDFLWARNLKDTLYGCMLDRINMFEGKSFNGNLCTSCLA